MTAVPEGAWDCHAHVFGDPARYPLSPGRGYDPPEAPLEAYLDVLDRHGLAHGVLVQPSVYGFDNRCMLDAMANAGGRLRGVAVPAPDSPPTELEALHRLGVRGVRVNLFDPGGLATETVVGWLPLLRELGWHVQFHLDVERVGDLRALVAPFDVPVVVDHMGRPRPSGASPDRPALRVLVDLVREGACFVKLSAPYRLSAEPGPWPDVAALAGALAAANPKRCVWATDWPHTQMGTSVKEGDLFEAHADWCSDPLVQRTVMVETPGRLYGTG